MRDLAFALGVLVCLTCQCGPAVAGTTSEALLILCGPRGLQYTEHVEAASRRYLLHPVVLAAVMANESSCRMEAVGAAGEVCAMQLMGVARNGHSKRKLARDARLCIHTGARWLSLRSAECGDGLRGIGAYNARKCGQGLGYARRVMALVERVWRELQRRREPRS